MLQRLTRRARRPPRGPAARYPFERLTDEARDCIALAQREARELGHRRAGTEHLLLGLLGGDGGAARALVALGVSSDRVRAELAVLVSCRTTLHPAVAPGAAAPGADAPPFSPRAKKVLELAWREARRRGERYAGTEHLLLGLVREGEGLAALILTRLRAEPARVVEEVMAILAAPEPDARAVRGAQLRGLLAEVLTENEHLHAEVARLRGLLRSSGAEPDDGTSRSA